MKQRSIYLDGLGHGKTPIPLASKVGGLLMTSGVNGRNRESGEMPDDIEGQLKYCFENLTAILGEADMSLDNVAKLNFVVSDETHRDAINQIWLEHYPDPAHRPARHVQVAPLRGKLLAQLEAMAFAG